MHDQVFLSDIVASYVGIHTEGSGPILLSGVSCSGSEQNITECESSSGVLHDLCTHFHDVSIFCSVLTEPGIIYGLSLLVRIVRLLLYCHVCKSVPMAM